MTRGRPPSECAAQLGVSFTDLSLLEQALTHRSWAYEHQHETTNERLEFLGDAVLGLVITDRIYRMYPSEPEGRLARMRAAVVQTSTLASIAREVALGDYIRLGRGESASGGASKDSILADTLEAVFGAVYLDSGFEYAFASVDRLVGRRLTNVADIDAALDFKTSLQEYAAAQHFPLPRYEVTESGPDHAKQFRATVCVNGDILGQGAGTSKKRAEQAAAKEAYLRLAPEI